MAFSAERVGERLTVKTPGTLMISQESQKVKPNPVGFRKKIDGVATLLSLEFLRLKNQKPGRIPVFLPQPSQLPGTLPSME